MCKRQADGYFLPIHLSGWWDTNANYAPMICVGFQQFEKIYRGMSGFVKNFTQSSFYGSCQAKKVSGGYTRKLKSLDATAVPV